MFGKTIDAATVSLVIAPELEVLGHPQRADEVVVQQTVQRHLVLPEVEVDVRPLVGVVVVRDVAVPNRAVFGIEQTTRHMLGDPRHIRLIQLFVLIQSDRPLIADHLRYDVVFRYSHRCCDGSFLEFVQRTIENIRHLSE